MSRHMGNIILVCGTGVSLSWSSTRHATLTLFGLTVCSYKTASARVAVTVADRRAAPRRAAPVFKTKKKQFQAPATVCPVCLYQPRSVGVVPARAAPRLSYILLHRNIDADPPSSAGSWHRARGMQDYSSTLRSHFTRYAFFFFFD